MSGVAIVTGGASGIGLATTTRLIEDGWRIGVLDMDENALSAAEEQFGDEAMFLKCDVTDEDDVADALDAVMDQFGLLSGLVNSAGFARNVSVEETDAALFRKLLDVNCVGSFITAHAVMERMAGSLSIVNISSVSGIRANRGYMALGASKAAVKMMTEIMALELGDARIRVNCVAPGPIDTPLMETLDSPREREIWQSRIPMNRYGTSQEVAEAISFLMSKRASYITGQTLAIDGGFSIAGIIKDG